MEKSSMNLLATCDHVEKPRVSTELLELFSINRQRTVSSILRTDRTGEVSVRDVPPKEISLTEAWNLYLGTRSQADRIF